VGDSGPGKKRQTRLSNGQVGQGKRRGGGKEQAFWTVLCRVPRRAPESDACPASAGSHLDVHIRVSQRLNCRSAENEWKVDRECELRLLRTSPLRPGSILRPSTNFSSFGSHFSIPRGPPSGRSGSAPRMARVGASLRQRAHPRAGREDEAPVVGRPWRCHQSWRIGRRDERHLKFLRPLGPFCGGAHPNSKAPLPRCVETTPT